MMTVILHSQPIRVYAGQLAVAWSIGYGIGEHLRHLVG